MTETAVCSEGVARWYLGILGHGGVDDDLRRRVVNRNAFQDGGAIVGYSYFLRCASTNRLQDFVLKYNVHTHGRRFKKSGILSNTKVSLTMPFGPRVVLTKSATATAPMKDA